MSMLNNVLKYFRERG